VNSGIFVIQGGGQRADGSQPQTHPAIVNEAKVSGLKNEAYTISMARMGKNPDGTGDGADTATSQFFINTKANPALDPGGSSPAGYAVFGLVIQGRDVVDAIQNAPADPSNPEKPVHAVAMQKVRIVGATAVSLSSSSTTSEPAPTCTSMPNGAPPPAGTAEVDLVTPGVWNVCSETDSNYVWVHNNGTSALDYTWSLTGAGGAALPEGWAATFATPAGTIAQAGATESAWAATVVTLHVPATQPAGEVPAELHAGGATRAFVFHVALPLGRVAVAGDNVMTHYDLWDSKGNAIQLDGDFCATLGPKTNAVSGYGYGLIGVAKGETVTLVVPPPFAYHYSGHSLSGKTLVWRATITDYGCAA
jgi:cyclophilin family peptidyl-prolyl cis-trans isomerase